MQEKTFRYLCCRNDHRLHHAVSVEVSSSFDVWEIPILMTILENYWREVTTIDTSAKVGEGETFQENSKIAEGEEENEEKKSSVICSSSFCTQHFSRDTINNLIIN